MYTFTLRLPSLFEMNTHTVVFYPHMYTCIAGCKGHPQSTHDYNHAAIAAAYFITCILVKTDLLLMAPPSIYLGIGTLAHAQYYSRVGALAHAQYYSHVLLPLIYLKHQLPNVLVSGGLVIYWLAALWRSISRRPEGVFSITALWGSSRETLTKSVIDTCVMPVLLFGCEN